jgi:hypothetical protein
LCGSHTVPADLESQPLRRAPIDGTENGQVHLSAMSMPGKYQANVVPRSKVNHAGIVRQQDRSSIARNSAYP